MFMNYNICNLIENFLKNAKKLNLTKTFLSCKTLHIVRNLSFYKRVNASLCKNYITLKLWFNYIFKKEQTFKELALS